MKRIICFVLTGVVLLPLTSPASYMYPEVSGAAVCGDARDDGNVNILDIT